MAEFVWEARARTGELRKGTMVADDEAAVQLRLRGQQLSPTRIKKKAASFDIKFGSGVGLGEVVTFTRLFATMIDAGLPIVQCLEILCGQTKNVNFAAVLREVKSSVEQGSTFSDALKRHPKVFDGLYVNLVQAGEVGGILDTILQRLATYYEKAIKLRRQVRGALVYPAAMIAIFAGVLAILLGFVIPSFQKIFKDLGSADALPGITKLVILTSDLFISYLPLIVLFIGLVAFGISSAARRPRGKRVLHKLMMMAPVIGPVLRKIAVARFTRTLGTLLNAGVPILDAMDIVARTAGNSVVEDAILYARSKIAEGKNMAGPLLESNVFPPMVVQMVGVGEQTGALDTMLSKIADFYEDEVDVAVAAMTSLIEPIMLVVIGGTVGTVLIAMYLPIFSLAGQIKGG
jgi:type IV pilus assembly protein PilC